VIATLSTGADSATGTLSSVYRRYYLPNAGDSTVTMIDLDRLARGTTAIVGRPPAGVLVDADADVAYVVNAGSDGLTVIGPGDGTARSFVATGGTPWLLTTPGDVATMLVVTKASNGADSGSVIAGSTPSDTAVAAEYASADGRYFHSADPAEKRLLDDGVFGAAWQATQGFFRVWTRSGAGRLGMCRLIGADGEHIYAFGDECRSLRQGNDWSYESIAYYVAAPDASGACAEGTERLYRLAANGNAVAHRYTTDTRLRTALQAMGWTAEGSGDDVVYACTPPLDPAHPAVASSDEWPRDRRIGGIPLRPNLKVDSAG
jgi:hypothetical protein